MDLSTLRSIHGRPVVYLERTDSTNRVARELAREDGAGLVIADHQSAGRGRLGRAWSAEAGQNLLFSAILRPDLPAMHAPRAVMIWAAAMADALGVWVKWPNDLVDGQDLKLGGLLAELETEGDRVRHVILGVGINVNQLDFPELPQATSLARIRGEAQDRVAVLRSVAAALYGADLSEDGLALWRARSRTLGRRVRVGEIEGLATGIRADGALLIDGRPVLAGDVSLIGESSCCS